MNIWLLRAGGLFTLFCAVAHAVFWWAFNWSTTLDPLGTFDWGVVLALNIAVTCFLFVLAGLSLLLPGDLLGTRLGRVLGWSIVGFWVVRAVDEFLVFADPSVALALACVGNALLYAVALLRTRGEHVLRAPAAGPR